MKNFFGAKKNHLRDNRLLRMFVAHKAAQMMQPSRMTALLDAFAHLDLTDFSSAIMSIDKRKTLDNLPATYYRALKSVLLLRQELRPFVEHNEQAKKLYECFYGVDFLNYSINLKGLLSHLEGGSLLSYLKSSYLSEKGTPQHGFLQLMLDELLVRVATPYNKELAQQVRHKLDERRNELCNYVKHEFDVDLHHERAIKKRARTVKNNLGRLGGLFESVRDTATNASIMAFGKVSLLFGKNINEFTSGAYKGLSKLSSGVMVLRLASVALIVLVPAVGFAATPDMNLHNSYVENFMQSVQEDNLIESLINYNIIHLLDPETLPELTTFLEQQVESVDVKHIITAVTEFSKDDGFTVSSTERDINLLFRDAILAQGVAIEDKKLFDTYTIIDIRGSTTTGGEEHRLDVYATNLPDELAHVEKRIDWQGKGFDASHTRDGTLRLRANLNYAVDMVTHSDQLTTVRRFEYEGRHGIILTYSNIATAEQVDRCLTGTSIKFPEVWAYVHKVVMVHGN